MIRPVATEIALFLAPFVLYALFLFATRAGMLDPQHWPLSRIATLAAIALVLMLGSFLLFAHFGGAPVGTTYVPAHLDESGKFVPGQTR
ncbi:MAG: hypothetical protein JO205_13810 [Pseudolabrys sp.]|nr:hypothetical protein [Pseudolabrys sp.]